MYVEQFDAGRMYSLLSQLVNLADIPPRDWNDHGVILHNIAQNAKELVYRIKKEMYKE